MVVPAESRFSLKSSKLTVVAISLLTIASTLYVYDEVAYNIADTLMFQARELRRRVKGEKKKRPKVLIWSLSYPHGGAEETINIVEHATKQSMGTNYGDEIQTYDMRKHIQRFESKSIDEDFYRHGPFVNNEDLPSDSNTVLVRAHCGGTCLLDPHFPCPKASYMELFFHRKRFWDTCAHGRSYNSTRSVPVIRENGYPRNRVKKTVITVRNPLTIVASRFKHHTQYLDEYEGRTNAKGLHDWCKIIDEDFMTRKEIKNLLKERRISATFRGVPCFTEFIRIMLWYDAVINGTLRRPHIIIRWEDYFKDLDQTARKLLRFIGLEKVDDDDWAFDTTVGDHIYTRMGHDTNDPNYEWFTQEEIDKIEEFMQAVGRYKSPAWDLLKNYFR